MPEFMTTTITYYSIAVSPSVQSSLHMRHLDLSHNEFGEAAGELLGPAIGEQGMGAGGGGIGLLVGAGLFVILRSPSSPLPEKYFLSHYCDRGGRGPRD